MRKKEYPYQNLSLGNMEEEEWDDIPGLDGYYCISNFGRIKRESFEIQHSNGHTRLMKPKILKPELMQIENKTVKDKVYFLRARITLAGKSYQISIARLLYYLFVRKFDLSNHYLVVLPKDGDGKNIHPDNLILTDIQRKQKRIYDRNRLERTFYHTYDEYMQEGVEKSVNPFCKQVTQYTMDGAKIKTYPSIKAAAITLGISSVGINSVLKDRQVSCGGFVWRYGKAKRTDMKSLWADKKVQFQKKMGQRITQYDLKGNVVAQYPAMAEAARATGTCSGDISLVVNGKQRIAGGFIWKKGFRKHSIDVSNFVYGADWRGQKRQKKITQYDPQGIYIQTFPSVKSAALSLGISPSYITMALSGKIKLAKGFIWKAAK